MSAQPSLIQIANDNEVLRPSNYEQWQLIRDRAAPALGKYYAYNKDGVKEFIGGAPGEGYTQRDIFTPTNNQTVFVLSSIVNLVFKPIMHINGQEQREGEDYFILGNVLTWINQQFHLNDTDRINIYYSSI